MKKSDLKSGMLVQVRGEGVYLIINDKLVSEDEYFIMDLNDDLTDVDGSEYDIMKVSNILENKILPKCWDLTNLEENLLWARESEKPFCKIDGVEYSKQTLRSLIKKATE